MFYLNSTLNFGIPPVLVFQLEVYYKVDRLLTGITAQQKGTTARWYSNKTSLFKGSFLFCWDLIGPLAFAHLCSEYVSVCKKLGRDKKGNWMYKQKAK